VVAFAVDGDYLILATREDLIAGALTLLANQHLSTLDSEAWFADAVKAAKTPGEVRMVIHLSEVAKTPQFRTYWIQQNITATRQYESSVTDLFRTSNEFREERVLVAKKAGDAAATSEEDARGVADLLRFVTPDASFYRAVAAPSSDTVLSLLEQKLLTPQLGPAPPPQTAPGTNLGDGAVGSDSNLETRIDVPPSAVTTGTKPNEMLRDVVTKANVRAVLALHRSDPASDGVFVRLRSTFVLRGSSDWVESDVRSAIQRVITPQLTASQLGAGWTTAPQGYAQLDGLANLAVSVQGKYLVVGNDASMMASVLARMSQPASAEPAVYVAAFNHERERQNFKRLFTLIDRPSRANSDPNGGGEPAEPQFFSGNIAGLSNVLAAVKSQSVVVHRSGELETQTVRYEWAR
jgi:hypothetical protein